MGQYGEDRWRNYKNGEKTGVSVHLTHQMAPLYDFFIQLHIVDKFDDAPCKSKTIDLDLVKDLPGATVKSRDAVLYVSSEGDVWNVHWTIDDSGPKIRRVTDLSAAKIECLMFTRSGSEKQRAERRQPPPFFVNMGLDEGIDSEWRERPLLPVNFQEYCASLGPRGTYAKNWDDLVTMLATPLERL
jgi:hypothetical protein